MTDYDAILFKEWCGFSQFIDPLYPHPPGYLVGTLKNLGEKVLGPQHHSTVLATSALVLRVRINGAWSEYDTLSRFPVWPAPVECVSAEILDTLKGRNFISTSCSHVTESSSPCIKFSYSPYWSKGDTAKKPRRAYVAPVTVTRDSTTGATSTKCVNCFGPGYFQLGKEYLIFLKTFYLDYDGQRSFYDYQPLTDFDASGGAYLIENGVLRDPNNYWNLGNQVSWQDFQTMLNQKIYAIEQQ